MIAGNGYNYSGNSEPGQMYEATKYEVFSCVP